MSDAKGFWEKRYAEKPFAQGKAPNKFLEKMVARLQKGKALDIAMGEGQNAVFLAQKGFEVKGFDLSATALTRAKQLAKESGVDIDAQTADLDLYLFGIMEYDSIVMTYFKPPIVRYYTEIVRALKQGGTLLVESNGLPEMNEAIPKEEAYRNHFFGSNELLRQLNGLRILFYQEGIEDGHHIVQCLAQKPLDKDAVKYNLFDMHSKNAERQGSKQIEIAESFFKK